MARSSSNSASWPWAITPPSRTKAAGSGSKLAVTNAAQAGSICKSAPMRCNMSVVGNRLGHSWACCRLKPSATNSRGRTWRRAMRAPTRPTSVTPLKASRKAFQGPAPCAPCKAATASKRCWATLRSRGGSSSQRLSWRLPMLVWQVSSKENRVGESSPRKVCTSSRLRRVVTGSSIKLWSRATSISRTWLKARPWVCSA